MRLKPYVGDAPVDNEIAEPGDPDYIVPHVKPPGDWRFGDTARSQSPLLITLRGDSAGHDFHGNQHTGGIGGGDKETGGKTGVLGVGDFKSGGGAFSAANGREMIAEAAGNWGYYNACTETRYAAECMLGQDHAATAVSEHQNVQDTIAALDGNSPHTFADSNAQIAVTDAHALLVGVRDAAPEVLPGYRGMTAVDGEPGAAALLGLKSGDTFDISLASFSHDPVTAESFVGSTQGTNVMMQLDTGYKAISSPGTETEFMHPVTGAWTPGFNDVITSGRFSVTGVEDKGVTGIGIVHTISITQTGVFNPDDGGKLIPTGGTRSTTVVVMGRGDVEGHGFHGNQHTGPIGGGDGEKPEYPGGKLTDKEEAEAQINAENNGYSSFHALSDEDKKFVLETGYEKAWDNAHPPPGIPSTKEDRKMYNDRLKVLQSAYVKIFGNKYIYPK